MKYFLVISLSLFLFSSCNWFSRGDDTKSADTAENNNMKPPAEEKYEITKTMLLIDSLRNLKKMPDFLSYHFKGSFKSDHQKLPLNGVCNISRDSVIWISARPGLGIEIGRVYFFTDSVFILDRVQSEYYAHSYKDISKHFKQSLSLDHFQALFAADILTLQNSDKPDGYSYQHKKDDKRILLYRKSKHKLHHEQSFLATGQLIENRVTGRNEKVLFKARYAYTASKPDAFPKKIKAEFPNAGNTLLELNIFKYSEASGNIPSLKIPGYYQRKYLKFN